jgi:uncharacterized protein
MREGGPVAPPALRAVAKPNCAGLAPETDADPAQFANLLGFAPLSEANSRRFAPRPPRCCESRAPCGKSPAREHNKPPGFPPSLPKRDHQPERRAEPGGADAQVPAQTPGGVDAEAPVRPHPPALRHPAPVPASLRPPRHRVSPTAVRYWAARALAGWLVVAGAQVVWMLSTSGHRGLHVLGLVVTALVGVAHAVVMPQWRYRVHRWEVAPEAVYTRAGWLHQESRIAPISRIQTVDSERGPLEQIFGLANVTVTTASAAGPLEIHGLDRATAQRLVDELTTAAQATRGDAT